MRVSLSAKQTAAISALIALSMTALTLQHVANLARIDLEDSGRNGELLARIIYQRSREAIAGAADPYEALRHDQGIRTILESTATYGRNVTYAAITNNSGIAVAHSFVALEGQRLEAQETLASILDRGTQAQIRAVYADRTLEVVQPLILGDSPFGAIRIGLSPVLIRADLSHALAPMLGTTILVTIASLFIGLVLARRVLRPIHVISSGLMRLQRGETDVTIELPPEEELRGLGESFKAIGEQLAARSLAGTMGNVEYARKLGSLNRLMAGLAHEVKNPLNAMTIHLELVRQHLSSAINSASSHAPVGAVLGISAAGGDDRDFGSGVAAIDSRMSRTLAPDSTSDAIDGAREHIEVIADEIKRLDEVIQGVLRFVRPQELQLQAVDPREVIQEVLALVEPDARRGGVEVRCHISGAAPKLQADATLLRQALLNLALNAYQSMPNGGILTMGAKTGDGRVVLTVEDTGVGIAADQLERIFDLFYTTKSGGSGIGLSMVFRIVQLHGGEIQVESTIGRGTSFRVLLPRA